MEISLTYTTLFLSWRKSPSDMFYAKLPALTIPGPLDFLLTYVVLAYYITAHNVVKFFVSSFFFSFSKIFYSSPLFSLSFPLSSVDSSP